MKSERLLLVLLVLALVNVNAQSPTGQPSRQPSMQPSSKPSRPSGSIIPFCISINVSPVNMLLLLWLLLSSWSSSSFNVCAVTGQPSEQPSIQPSRQPNSHPSSQPSEQPSGIKTPFFSKSKPFVTLP